MAEKETTMDELTAIAKALDSGKSLDEARKVMFQRHRNQAEPETQADPPPEPEQPKQDESASSDADSSLTEKTEQEKPDISREAGHGAKDAFWKSLNDERNSFKRNARSLSSKKKSGVSSKCPKRTRFGTMRVQCQRL